MGELRAHTGGYWLFGRNTVHCTARTRVKIQVLMLFLSPPVPAGRTQPHVFADALCPLALPGLGFVLFCDSKSLCTQHKDQ